MQKTTTLSALLGLSLLWGGTLKAGNMKGKHLQNSTKKAKQFVLKKSQIAEGKALFGKNCISCHGRAAVGGTIKIAGVKPPSLNGAGGSHVAHHAPQKLLHTIAQGRKGMPSFGSKLKSQERKAIFSYLHSLWPQKMQKHYDKKFNIKVVK